MSNGSSTPDRPLVFGLVIAALGSILWVFGQLLLGKSLFYSDFSLIYHPLVDWWARALSGGAVPWWNPELAFGLPQAANPLAGTFYPPMLLVLGLGTEFGLSTLTVAHVAWMAAGCYRWARVSGADPLAAGLAASCALAGAYVSTTAYGYMTFAWAWVPWTLAAAAAHRPWLIAITAALTVLAGSPLAAAIGAMLVVAGYGRRTVRWWRHVGLAYALALGLAGIQLLPAMAFVPESVRATGAVGAEGVWSLAPSRLVGLWLPDFFGRFAPEMSFWGAHLTDGLSDGNFFYYSLYAGALPWLLLPAALRSPQRRLVLGLLGAFVLCTWLALGRHGGLYVLLNDWLPGFSMFRYPERWMLPATLALVGAATFGAATSTGRELAWVGIPIGLSALATLGLDGALREHISNHVPGGLVDAARTAQVGGALHVLAVLVAVTIIFRWLSSTRQRTLAIAVIALVDVAVAHQPIVWTGDADLLLASRPMGENIRNVTGSDHPVVARHAGLETQRLPKDLDGLRGAVKRNGLTLRANAGLIAGVRTLHTESPARLAHPSPPDQWFWHSPGDAAPILGVQLALVSLERPPEMLRRHLQPGGAFRWLHQAPELGLGIVGPTRPPLAPVFCTATLTTPRVGESIPDALARIVPLRTALFEGPASLAERLPAANSRDAWSCGTATPQAGSTSYSLSITLDEPAAVIWRQAYASGWRWTLGDTEVPTFRAYGSLTGTVLPAGKHTITANYQLPGLQLGAWLTLLSALLVAVWWRRGDQGTEPTTPVPAPAATAVPTR